MGYTHYYKIPKELNAKKFAKLSEELKCAAMLLPTESNSAQMNHKGMIYLADGYGENEPEFTSELIAFNGRGEDAHESFYIQQKNNEESDFCKTARKPYDLMVCVSLMRLKHYFPKVHISSDGDESDWADAKIFYTRVFGQDPPKFKL